MRLPEANSQDLCAKTDEHTLCLAQNRQESSASAIARKKRRGCNTHERGRGKRRLGTWRPVARTPQPYTEKRILTGKIFGGDIGRFFQVRVHGEETRQRLSVPVVARGDRGFDND